MEKTQITQIGKANKTLIELSVNVTKTDKDEAKKTFSEFTIIQYLKGRGKNLDTAIELIQFFRNRISKRDKVLS